jgi:thiamine-monophosphate kinase
VASPPPLDEFGLIRRCFAPLAAGAAGAEGLENDAARLALDAGEELIATKDLMVAGVHFPHEEEPALIARKLLRVNLSDLAAMGARPIGYLLGLALPRDTELAWLDAFAGGLGDDQKSFGLDLLGGDTVATDGPLTLSLTALGSVERGAAFGRSGARPEDRLYVSGTIGDGVLGLRALRGELDGLDPAEQGGLIARYRLPEPRLGLGRALHGLASAVIDVSDGLVADLGHVCEASGVAAVIEAPRIPLSAGARAALGAGRATLGELITGGDDYELLFSVPEAGAGGVAAASRESGVAVARIGRIVSGGGVSVKSAEGTPIPLERPGYRHF